MGVLWDANRISMAFSSWFDRDKTWQWFCVFFFNSLFFYRINLATVQLKNRWTKHAMGQSWPIITFGVCRHCPFICPIVIIYLWFIYISRLEWYDIAVWFTAHMYLQYFRLARWNYISCWFHVGKLLTIMTIIRLNV